MTLYQRFVANQQLRRLVVLMGMIGVIFAVRSMMNIILLTFIFTFLVTQLVRHVQRYVRIPPAAVVVPLYILVILLVYLGVTIYVPQIAKQTIKLGESVYNFYQSPSFDANKFMQLISQYMKQFNLTDQLKHGVSTLVNYITGIGTMGVTIVLSFILSFFYTIELDKLPQFGGLFLKSTYGWLFQDIAYFAKKFVNTFGVVIEAQIFIAVVNTVLTTITLTVMKMPNIPSLAIMIFLLSMVPVAGVILSCIPLCIIAFSVGGVQYVVYILVMITVIHALEAYVLNPRFMSSKTQLPIFFTFVVLFVAERFLGTWGLIVGLPIFTFFLDVLGVKTIKTK
ncbi:AI-2E family transporter [Latilactobacillus sp. 5-91]|uniref:AI-2E family transporter n=1 Tax=Latilactobacillus sp. 5-91 TaxID=3410924 RepID=UPI003C7121DE